MTAYFSSDSVSVADIIPAMDSIDEAFATGIIDKQTLSNPIRHALLIGKKTMNKYYTLSDDSDIYRIAMGKYWVWLLGLCSVVLTSLYTVLHPSLKLEYFSEAQWTSEWVVDATQLTRDAWERRYKPLGAVTTDVQSVSSFFVDAWCVSNDHF